jgi:mono/diheme cytochrome c family protein
VLAIVVIVAGIAMYINFSGIPKYEARKINLKVEVTQARVERGRDLAMTMCRMCHYNQTTKTLSGTRLLDMPPEFGKAFSKNITQHPTQGIGKWSDGDIAWLLRTGIHPHTGAYVPPWMIKLPNMADEDLYSIIAWLRSDDPLLAATDQDNTQSEPSFMAKALCYVAFKPFEYPTKPIAYPDTTNTVAYGRYIVTAVHDCYGCHLSDFANYNQLEPEKSVGFCGGGMAMPDANGLAQMSANITPDKETGIGKWTRDEFIKTLKTGVRPDGKPLRYPMTRMHTMSDHAAGCIYDYLRTIPTISQKVARSQPKGPWADDGEKLFDMKGCTSCHGKNGVGYATLKAADAKYPDDSVLVDVIKEQIRYNPDGFMPRYADVLNDAELATLAQHVRVNFASSSRKRRMENGERLEGFRECDVDAGSPFAETEIYASDQAPFLIQVGANSKTGHGFHVRKAVFVDAGSNIPNTGKHSGAHDPEEFAAKLNLCGE